MTVRRLGAGDAADLHRTLELFRGYDRIEPEPFLSDSATVAFVAEADEEIVGWAYGYRLSRPEGTCAFLLYEVEVVPRARRRGHGSALIAAWLEEAERRGCRKAWALADAAAEAAIEFYQATGARPADEQAMLSWPLRNSRKVEET